MLTENTYKAAYYLTQGAKLIDVKIRYAQPNKKKLIMTKFIWVIELAGVPLSAIAQWEMGVALCNVQALETERKRIKKLAKKKRL